MDGKGGEKRDLFGSGLCSGLIGRDLPVKLASIVELKRLLFRVVQHFTFLNVPLLTPVVVRFTS